MRTRPVLCLLSSSIIVVASGCLERPIEPVEPSATTTFTQSLPSEVTKIDLLLAIDNSSSMADKQAILAAAVPSLVGQLLNPSCVDVNGKAVSAAQQPQDPLATCPPNTSREFPPVTDVHVGIVSSSLGGRGFCKPDPSVKDSAQLDDGGRLVARTLAGAPAVPTHDDHDFLAWSPKDKTAPSGETNLADFEENLRALVAGVGEKGCGYEAQLESWFRFLVEPVPNDEVLQHERDDFLRPDSLVTIVVLTDENDCSVVPDGYAEAFFDTDSSLPKARAICASNPDDHCCAPCGYEPSDCPNDPTCRPLNPEEDLSNLRCFDQKHRFGHDFLYPTQRYVDALTKETVDGLDGKSHPNPLFPGLNAGATGRTPAAALVYLAGIVGVPWQDIARKNAQGQPDLKQGLDADGHAVGGFLSSGEMSQTGGNWGTTWDLILGDATKGTAPADALMRESTGPRAGSDPLLGAAIAPPDANSPAANPINGHEWTTSSDPIGDLQYACIFPIENPIVCNADGTNCDCGGTSEAPWNNPLCQAADGSYGRSQLRAKAYPGVRQLEVLRGLGELGIVASICPADLDVNQPDYGYKPAVGAIVEKLKQRIAATCLPLTLTPQKDGSYPCIVLEAHQTQEGCDCKSAGRHPVSDKGALQAEKEANAAYGSNYACFCEIDQLDGAERDACETDAGYTPSSGGQLVNGWCYVDPLAGVGKPEVVQNCPSGEKRQLRLVNGAQPEGNTTTYITCTD